MSSSSRVSSSLSSMSSRVSSSIGTNSALVTNGAVAASSVAASANSTSFHKSSKTKNGAVSMIASPVSWKYGVAIGAFLAGSFVLGAGI
ncbi:Hypothetical protein J6889_03510 [Nakaseomyces glabratus]|nr:hypothetical protein LTX96_0000730 [Nakaseomyces glabratus]